MNVDTIPNLVRDTKRFHQIVSTLARYGLAPWLSGIKSDWVQRLLQSADGRQISEMTVGARLREAFTELGPTFIKLGQILSTRPDLVGPDITEELSRLQSGTPADPPEVVRATIQSELNACPEELFAEFDDRSAASASIGQIHFARLHDGHRVVVKVQHPDIENRIRSDLEIMKTLAEVAEQYSQQAKQYRPVDTITEFARTLLSELDFTREQRNLDTFRHNFDGDPHVVIPQPWPQVSTRRVLTMERLAGISLADADQLVAEGHDLASLARRGADIFMDMIFRDGFYHADPHPGNLFALEHSAIGLLDCGMVGRIDDRLREQFEDLLLSLAEKDSQAVCDSICQLGSVPRQLDTDDLQTEIDDFIAEYGSQNLDEFDLGGALNRMMEIIRRFQIILPSRVALLIKVLVMLEGTARELNPHFNLTEVILPYQQQIISRRLAPERLMKKAKRNLMDWNRLVEMAPRELADILTQIKRGRFDVHLEHRKLDAVINRMVMGVLTAALFVGSAMILSSEVPPLFRGISVIGAAGCLAASWMGISLWRAILKSGNIYSQ